jgi:soluble lytic murein transglycosylase-like protein
MAKSNPGIVGQLNTEKLAHWARGGVSIMVLMASLTALTLIVYNQHGARFLETYARILSRDAHRSTDGAEADNPASNTASPEERRYRALADFLAKRYRVSPDVTLDLVNIAYAAGQQIGLDPLLIIAVMAIESRFNPIAESVSGAKGLMQIIPKYHPEKFEEFGGEQSVFDPETNIQIGALILKEYLKRTGNMGMALQMYAGAAGTDDDAYFNKVMGEKLRLQRVAAQFAPPARSVHTKDSPAHNRASQSAAS